MVILNDAELARQLSTSGSYLVMKAITTILLFTLLIWFNAGCGSIKTIGKGAGKTGKAAVDTVSLGVRVLKYPARIFGKSGTKVGVASWYGDKYHGRMTANGEIYNMYKLTAAHRTLPFDTRLKVTNLKNRRSVVVRINDRGPFIRGRMIDLSYGAAKKLGMVKDGVQKVELKILR